MPGFVKIVLVIFLGATLFTVLHQKSENPPSVQPVYKPRSDVIYHGEKEGKVVALTFDADMTPKMKKRLQSGDVKSWYNKGVIDVLREKKVPATLFITGMWAEIYPDVTKELALDPLFEIENHSYSHPAFSFPCYKLSPISNSLDAEQIDKTQKILFDLTGKTPHYFRFPGGCFDKTDVSIVHEKGLDVIQWDVASGDAFNKSADSIVNRVVSGTKPDSIIVMHLMGGPNAPVTAVALPRIIEGLEKKGFRFVKLTDLLN